MDEVCQQLFDQSWAKLDIEDIRCFVAGEAEEGLAWEATSGRIDSKKGSEGSVRLR